MKITKKDCINEINCIYHEYGKVTNKLINEYSQISADTIKRRFGSLVNAYKEAGIELKQGQRKKVSKEEIVKEIIRIKEEYGYVSKPLMEKYSSYSPKIVQRIFGSFSNMYSELNLERHPSGRIPTDEDLVNEAKRIYEEQGYLSWDLINKYSTISKTCFTDRMKKNNWNGGIAYLRNKIGCEQPVLNWCESPSAKFAIDKFTKIIGEEPIKEKTFDWLLNKATNQKLRIDAYYPNANIAIEYNGPQHYYIDGLYTKDQEALDYRKTLDMLKYNLIKSHGVHLIVIHFKDKIDSNYIKQKLSTK